MRVLGIDYGNSRIGLAITDMDKKICYPHKTVKAGKSFDEGVKNILDAINQFKDQIEMIVFGLPIHMNGKPSEMSRIIIKFIEFFRTKTAIAITSIDERLTSKMAERDLIDNFKLNRKKRSLVIDPLAATIILQNYLDRNSILSDL